MARFLVVLQPSQIPASGDLITALNPLLQHLAAEVEHRTTVHLSALLRDAGDNLSLQLFADVQAKKMGPVLELVLMSREAMGRGAPLTHQRFRQLLSTLEETAPQLQLLFRSDRDGPVPDQD
ncbi:MAG: hypothetical protein ACKO0M_19055 [Cyanobium sp.]